MAFEDCDEDAPRFRWRHLLSPRRQRYAYASERYGEAECRQGGDSSLVARPSEILTAAISLFYVFA